MPVARETKKTGENSQSEKDCTFKKGGKTLGLGLMESKLHSFDKKNAGKKKSVK